MGISGFDILNESFWSNLPPELISKITGLVTILKVTGVVVIGYIIFLIIKWILGIRRYKKISVIYKKVNIIDKKLDLLLGKRKLEELKETEIKETKKEKKRKRKSFSSVFRKK